MKLEEHELKSMQAIEEKRVLAFAFHQSIPFPEEAVESFRAVRKAFHCKVIADQRFASVDAPKVIHVPVYNEWTKEKKERFEGKHNKHKKNTIK
jgi:hypothetical protein